MTDQFVAEIRAFPFHFAPKGWALCNGQILPISQNTALFSLLGTTYGGDGKSTFGLPDLRGSAVMHPGRGPGLSPRRLGETGGSETVTLTGAEIPAHNHVARISGRPAVENDAGDQYWAVAPVNAYSDVPNNVSAMADSAIQPAGGSLPHDNMQPYLVLNFCIALQGVFPPHP